MKSNILYTVVVLYVFVLTLDSVTCRPRRNQNHEKHRGSNSSNDVRSWRRLEDERDQEEEPGHSNHIRRNHKTRGHWSAEDELDSDEGDHGRHAYVMSTDHLTPSPPPEDEDKTLQEAFQKHMNLKNQPMKNPHDIYAYKLPSELWFIVRYKKNAEGKTDKYMNVVSSFTNYLDKLDTSTKSVSVNVKGVETVFRLTSKP